VVDTNEPHHTAGSLWRGCVGRKQKRVLTRWRRPNGGSGNPPGRFVGGGGLSHNEVVQGTPGCRPGLAEPPEGVCGRLAGRHSGRAARPDATGAPAYRRRRRSRRRVVARAPRAPSGNGASPAGQIAARVMMIRAMAGSARRPGWLSGCGRRLRRAAREDDDLHPSSTACGDVRVPPLR